MPWDRFPVNPHVGGGIVTHFLHKEFATKGCPWAAVADWIDEFQARIRAILRAAQEDSQPAEPVDPRPVTPDHDWWPQGYGIEQMRARFGALVRHLPDGTIRRMHFDPEGVISNAWVARGVAEQRSIVQLPPARDWWTHPAAETGQIDLVTFDDGWTLTRTHPNLAWRWT